MAIYVRVSSAMQVEDGFSLEAQLKAGRKFAVDRGWQEVAVYEEPGVSGKDDNRPAFQRMIRAAEAGHDSHGHSGERPDRVLCQC
mgnify:CR=1 FL=1